MPTHKASSQFRSMVGLPAIAKLKEQESKPVEPVEQVRPETEEPVEPAGVETKPAKKPAKKKAS